jgi:hypothetical protein
MIMAFSDTLSSDCKGCSGLRPSQERVEKYGECIGEKIELDFRPGRKPLEELQTRAETCAFCAFVKSVLEHYCREWGTPVAHWINDTC